MPKTVFLLPGLLCDEEIWRHQRAALDHEFDIRIPRFLGLNRITAMAERVLQDAPERFALAGHSMGGRVALEIHRLARERILRLMLLDTGVAPVRAGEAEERAALVDLARENGMKALAEAWLPGMVREERWKDESLMAPLTAMVQRATPEDFTGQIEALLNRPDARPELTRISCPTAIVCGRQDKWSPLDRHEMMHRAIAHSKLVVIEDSGHMTPVEQPSAVTQALRDWLT
ncbi:MAG TPA: alpha/beta hydrolase [Alphaproteobacteria bacterium]|nr:alpha/beta hydrolase [Alphaproteobacteria bacterium]